MAHSVERGVVLDISIFVELTQNFEIGSSAGDFGCFHQFFSFNGEGFIPAIFFPNMKKYGEKSNMGQADPWICVYTGHEFLQYFFHQVAVW